MITDADWARIARRVFGEHAGVDPAQELQWVKADPERSALYDDLSAICAAAPPRETTWDVNRAWERVCDGAVRVGTWRDADGRVPAPRSTIKARGSADRWAHARTSSALVRGLRSAAVGALVAVGVVIVWMAHARATRPVALREITTAPGQRVTLTLTDSTRIFLGPASTLRYPVDFLDRDRRLELEGEAYFEVHHDPVRPLTIRTPRAVASDIGTKFAVRDYAADHAPKVTVAEGSVAVTTAWVSDRPHQPQVPLLLSPGQIAEITPTGTVRVHEESDLDPDLAWARGELVFRNAPLSEVLPELSRWYGVTITTSDSLLGTLLITSSFNTESATEAVNAVAAALALQVKHDGHGFALERFRARPDERRGSRRAGGDAGLHASNNAHGNEAHMHNEADHVH